jgi:hypothetical protein
MSGASRSAVASARRERSARDATRGLDEVWQGVRHVVPGPSIEHADIGQAAAELLGPPARAAGLRPTMSAFNLGASRARLPRARRRPAPARSSRRMAHATAALIVEILSRDDEIWQKLPFYAAHDVDGILIVDPAERTVTWLGLRAGEYQPIQRSALIKLGPVELAARLDWP